MYAERRARFLEQMGPGAVAILCGAKLCTRSADTHYPFRQDSDFHYLTGFDHPHAAAVLRSDGGPRFTLYVEPRQREAEIWTGRRPGVEGALADYDADAAKPIQNFLDDLPELARAARRIYCVLGRNAAFDAKLLETLEQARLHSRRGVLPAEAIIDPRNLLHEMRLYKTTAEVDLLRRAAEITCAAHREAARLAQPGRREYELQAALEYTFRILGSAGPAYSSIVGGGANATILHYTENRDVLREGQLVLIDAGCEFESYASDVTRVYPIGGRFQGAARELYEVVLAAQAAALAVAAPGPTLERVHAATVSALVEGLLALGLLAGSAEECIAKESYRRYYMHRTSHWLGLDVHDAGAYTQDGKARPLEAGMVFTVEPGLYVAEDDVEAAARFRGIGVRIEDDVLITKNGSEVLTAAIPKQPEAVEAWVRGD